MPPNSMTSGGKKEQMVRHSHMQLATQLLQLLLSLTPLEALYYTCIFKSHLATNGEGAFVGNLWSKEKNSC